MDPELPGGHQQGQREGEAGQQGERGVEYGQHLQIHIAYEDKTTISQVHKLSLALLSPPLTTEVCQWRQLVYKRPSQIETTCGQVSQN